MIEYSYGVVVEDSNPNYNIWTLFKGIEAGLTALDGTKCPDPLRVGAIVQACTDTKNGETRIRSGWPYPESIWSDKGRVVIRTIVSYNADVTIDRGKWIDEATNIFYVILVSRDIGIVLAPTQWYNREFFDAGECHMFVYAEFRPRALVSAALPEEHSEFFWSIIEDRLNLPVLFPSKDLEPDRFLEPDEIRKVPVITVQRQGTGMLVWSYGLGNKMSIILNHEGLDVGMWLEATVIRSSPSDLRLHGCTFTVVKYELAALYTQPEVRVVNDTILMVLTLSRTEIEPGNPAAGVKLYHDFWGLQVGFDGAPEWVRGENGDFRGVVEVGLSTEEEFEGRCVSIKAIGPAPAPRAGKDPIVSTDVDASGALADMVDLKNALLEENEEYMIAASEGAESAEQLTNESLNDTNNNDDEWYQMQGDQTTNDRSMQSPDGMRGESAEANWGRGMQDPWEMNSATNTPEKKGSKRRQEVALNWRDVGKEENKEKKEKEKTERAVAERIAAGENGCDGIVRQDPTDRGANARQDKGKGRGLWKSLANTAICPSSSGPPGSGSGAALDEPAQDAGSGGIGFAAASRIPMQEAMTEPAPSQKQYQGAPPITTDAPSGQPVKPKNKSGFNSENIVGPVPIRAFDDKKTEKKWKKEMMRKGWEFPKEPEEIVIPDGEDGWEQCGAKDFGKLVERVKPPMPVENLINKRTIVRDAMRLKLRQCLITKVRFDFHWRYAEKVQLFILDGTPAYLVHNMNRPAYPSYLKNLPEFTTVGNVVELHVGRSQYGFYVHDEMWRLVQKVQLPMREVVFEPGRTKTLELIVNCRCLGPDAQDRHNDRHRYDEKGFTMLNDYILHNIAYYGRGIDAREHEDYTFQIVVTPEEVLEGHAFWKATEVLWRVQVEKIPENAWMPDPSLVRPRERSPLPPMAPVHVELKASINDFQNCTTERQKPGTVARETRLEELFTLYGKLMENDRLMTELHRRTGTDYKKKFLSAIEVGQTAMPHKKSMKRELQINADFLVSIVENAYSEEIFKGMGEKRLWKSLVRTSDSIKAFRNTVNNR